MFSNTKEPKQVKLNVINAIELKPECNYILVADSKVMKMKEVKQVMADLKKANIKNVISFYVSTDPDEALQVISKEKYRATKHPSN